MVQLTSLRFDILLVTITDVMSLPLSIPWNQSLLDSKRYQLPPVMTKTTLVVQDVEKVDDCCQHSCKTIQQLTPAYMDEHCHSIIYLGVLFCSKRLMTRLTFQWLLGVFFSCFCNTGVQSNHCIYCHIQYFILIHTKQNSPALLIKPAHLKPPIWTEFKKKKTLFDWTDIKAQQCMNLCASDLSLSILLLLLIPLL